MMNRKSAARVEPDVNAVQPFDEQQKATGATPVAAARTGDSRPSVRRDKWGSEKEVVFTAQGYGRVRELLRLQVTNPSSPFNLVIMLVIFVATLTMMLETLPELDEYVSETQWALIEGVCVFIFTVELLVKLMVTPINKLHYFFVSPMNLIDLVAILPFYLTLFTSAFAPVECWTGFLVVGRGEYNRTAALDCETVSSSSLTFLRAFRLARVIRVLKLGNFSAGVKVFTVAIMKSTPQLVAIFFFMMIAMIIFSSAIFYAETGCDDDTGVEQVDSACARQKSHFRSIPATTWWCIVTMTTVGYGDMYPTTEFGKVIAVPTMLAGILIFALPITVIGSNYEAAFHNEVMRRLITELQLSIKQHFKTKSEITLADVQRLTKKWSSRWTADHAQLYERLEMMWDMYDLTLDGQLDGSLSKRQMAKLIEDLRLQIEDNVQMQPGDNSPSQRMLMVDHEGKRNGEEESTERGAEPSAASADRRGSAADFRMSERRGSSCATAMGAAGRRGSIGRGSAVGQKGAMFMQVVETRVTVIEQSIEAQDASLQHITASLQLLAAALEVQLPPPPGPPNRVSSRQAAGSSSSYRKKSVSIAHTRRRSMNAEGAAIWIQAHYRGLASRRSLVGGSTRGGTSIGSGGSG